MKDTILSIIRIALTAVGAYLIGQDIWGQAINDGLWNEIIGAALALVGTVWGIVDKSATIEQIQSGVRSVVVVIGGLLVASGKMKAELLTAILGIIAIVIPAIQSATSKAKVSQIQSGKLSTSQLKGGS